MLVICINDFTVIIRSIESLRTHACSLNKYDQRLHCIVTAQTCAVLAGGAVITEIIPTLFTSKANFFIHAYFIVYYY